MWGNLNTVTFSRELVNVSTRDIGRNTANDLHAASGLMQTQISSVDTLPLSTTVEVPMPPMQKITSNTDIPAPAIPSSVDCGVCLHPAPLNRCGSCRKK